MFLREQGCAGLCEAYKSTALVQYQQTVGDGAVKSGFVSAFVETITLASSCMTNNFAAILTDLGVM